MGIADLSGDDEVEQTSDDPSVSYIYVYEAGRKEIEGWPQDKQQTMARAYNAVSDGGIVRTTFKRNPQFVNIHDGMAHLLAAMAEGFENQNWVQFMEFVLSEDSPELSASIIGDYLEENPEVLEELTSGEAEEIEAAAD